MKEYDVVVIGAGCGIAVVREAVSQGLKVALVAKGPLGGTCLNFGCVPSKMLMYPSDRIVEIQEAKKFGIEVEIKNIDFKFIMNRMRQAVEKHQSQIRQDISKLTSLDFYRGEGHFVADNTIEVNGERIRGEKIFIASGTRSLIPPIGGIESIDYLTSDTVLELKQRPESVIIIGGGYIGVEYAHFFAAMGTKVTILEMADRLVLAEEREISHMFEKELSKRMDIYTNVRVERVERKGNDCLVVANDLETGRERDFTSQRIMVAVGRKSNADILKVENTGVETDETGFIRVNEYLETSRKDIYAVGDANGQQMFVHTAEKEVPLAVQNALHHAGLKMDYSAAPRAVFSHPQIASVGLTEESASKNYDVLVSTARYSDITMGEAMIEDKGFAKAIVERGSGKILGFHIIGPHASILIQEVVNAMASGGHIDEINKGSHIHPALSELIRNTIRNLEES